MVTFKRHADGSSWGWLVAWAAVVGLGVRAVGAAESEPPEKSRLELKTERVIVFKDGYALVLKRGAAVTDNRGRVYTDEVPDAAVLGSFWAMPKQGTLKAMVAGWVEEKQQQEKKVRCLEVIEVLKANVGKKCSVELPDQSRLTGVIQEVLTHETTAPISDRVRAMFGVPPMRSAISSARTAPATPRQGQSQAVSGIVGTHFVLRTDDGDVLLAAKEIRRLTIRDMQTKLPRTVTTTRRVKRLTFRFARSGVSRELLIAYFRPGLRWIPTYRVSLTEDDQQRKVAEIAMQAEIMNEAEDLIGAPIDIVVGVPNFRFRSIPSPLVLERTLRNALREAAPQIMGQFDANALSNAMFTQRAGEFRRDAARPPAPPVSAPVELPRELTTAAAQELFVYHLDRLTLRKGQRAAVPVFTARAPYRDVYTWNLHARRSDIAAAPSGSGVRSPLVLSKNEVWRQIELTNTTDVPWTTGAALIVQDQQPLAQELLTYTSPKATCRVPVTVAVDLRTRFEEQEVERQWAALKWGGYNYAKIVQNATLTVHNHKSHAVDVELTFRVGGRATKASHDGRITLLPYRAEDWERHRGDPAVNNSSTVFWRVRLEAGQSFAPTVTYHYYTRQ